VANRKKENPLRRLPRALGVAVVLAVVVPALFVAWRRLDWSPPQVRFKDLPEVLGRKSTLTLEAKDEHSGLRSVQVFLTTKAGPVALPARTYLLAGWLGGAVREDEVSVDLELDRKIAGEGPATVEVYAEDYSWLSRFRTVKPAVTREVSIDLTPPALEVLTSQHYMRLGGSELVLYRTSKDAVRSGVAVEGDYFFPGTAGLFSDPAVHAALFAVPQDLSADARPRVVAVDAAGNRREVGFFCSVKPQAFPQRKIPVSDDFLERKVPEIAAATGLAEFPDRLEGYLYINRTLRRETEERVRQVCSVSSPRPLWDGPFLQQGGTKVMSGFADRRAYVYEGREVDTQVHLGYDLAAVRNSPVAAAGAGRVVLAEYLGIYGNSVIIDHGLGLFTLYGHLGSIAAEAGRDVKNGEVIGRTGETGLAGGDHLHFSVMLYGIHVDAVEWWDAKWVREHIQAKLASPQPDSGSG